MAQCTASLSEANSVTQPAWVTMTGIAQHQSQASFQCIQSSLKTRSYEPQQLQSDQSLTSRLPFTSQRDTSRGDESWKTGHWKQQQRHRSISLNELRRPSYLHHSHFSIIVHCSLALWMLIRQHGLHISPMSAGCWGSRSPSRSR